LWPHSARAGHHQFAAESVLSTLLSGALRDMYDVRRPNACNEDDHG
jgi:hypothetical protein